jgi:quinol monooxygenase YgiN
LIVFQAGIGSGSAIWGTVATRSSLGTAYVGIAVGLALSALIGSRLKLAAGEGIDHTPARHWPAPQVAGEPSLEAGPIMIQVEYRIDPAHASAFGDAMRAVGRSHRRNGALQWWLFRDTADPARFVETWIETTWAEHLRTHERVSVAHRDIEQIARDLSQAGASIEIRHFISAYAVQVDDRGGPLPGVAGPRAT